MTKPTEQYNEASNLLSHLLTKDFELIEELFCDEIADQLYDDFMKDRNEEGPYDLSLQEQINDVRNVVIAMQIQIAKIAIIIKSENKLANDDAKMNDLEKSLKDLMKAFE